MPRFTFCTVVAILAALALVPAASAATSISATGTTVSAAAPNTTTALSGISVASAGPSDDLYVIVSTDLGILSVSDSSPEGTLAYGYSSWTDQPTIAFTGTQSQVNDDLSTLELTTGSTAGQAAHISVTAFPYDSGSDLVYSPTNGHFYQYVSDPGISWTQAALDASQMSYGGQQGYLASIPTEAVNDLITNKIPDAQSVWFGAYAVDSSATPARTWYWYGGPLAGQALLECQNLNTSNDNFDIFTMSLQQDNDECTTENGYFANWSSGEPNDDGGTSVCSQPLDQDPLVVGGPGCADGEHYAVTNWNSYNGLWNDLNNDAGGGASGYVVEYGDLVNGTSTPFTGVGSVTSDVSVGNLPGQPTAPSATLAGTTATVSWTQPVDDGGWPLLSYTVTASTGQTCTVAAPATSCEIPGLPYSTDVSFTVTATTQYGTSAPSVDSNSVSVEAAPTTPQTTTTTANLTPTSTATTPTPPTATPTVTRKPTRKPKPTSPRVRMHTPPKLIGTVRLSATVSAHVRIRTVRFEYRAEGRLPYTSARSWLTACSTTVSVGGAYSCRFDTRSLVPGETYRFRALAIDTDGDVGHSRVRVRYPHAITSNLTSGATPVATPPSVRGRVSMLAGHESRDGRSLTLSAVGSRAAPDSKITGYSWSVGGRIVGRRKVAQFRIRAFNRPYVVGLAVTASNGAIQRMKFRVEDVEREFTATVHFGYNDATLTNRATAVLHHLVSRITAAVGQRSASIELNVSGYASASIEPFGAQNAPNELLLSRERAWVAGTLLRRSLKRHHGVQIKLDWYGGADPVASNFSLAGQARNRRVVITADVRTVRVRHVISH